MVTPLAKWEVTLTLNKIDHMLILKNNLKKDELNKNQLEMIERDRQDDLKVSALRL